MNDDTGAISDGYHTFDELYDHRCILFIAWMCSDGCPGDVYWVREHYEGWDLLACNIKSVGQISYHVKKKFRHLYEEFPEERVGEGHIYDGHTSKDVYERIFKWCES